MPPPGPPPPHDDGADDWYKGDEGEETEEQAEEEHHEAPPQRQAPRQASAARAIGARPLHSRQQPAQTGGARRPVTTTDHVDHYAPPARPALQRRSARSLNDRIRDEPSPLGVARLNSNTEVNIVFSSTSQRLLITKTVAWCRSCVSKLSAWELPINRRSLVLINSSRKTPASSSRLLHATAMQATNDYVEGLVYRGGACLSNSPLSEWMVFSFRGYHISHALSYLYICCVTTSIIN